MILGCIGIVGLTDKEKPPFQPSLFDIIERPTIFTGGVIMGRMSCQY
jgi:hypothetical protein